jgi:HEAT repeat protein
VDRRSRKVYILWGTAIGLLLALALSCWILVFPALEVRAVLARAAKTRGQHGYEDRVIEELGGQERGLRLLSYYLSLPRRLAPNRKRVPLCLARCGTPALPALERALLDPDMVTGNYAACALSNLSTDGLPALLRAMDHPDELIRARACGVIGSVRPVSDEAIARTIGLLGEKSSLVRLSAAQSLGAMGPAAKRAGPELLQVLDGAGKSDRALAGIVEHSLVKIGAGTDRLVPELIKQLEAGRWQAALYLCEYGPAAEAAVPALARALKSNDLDVRWRAAWALGEIGGKPKPAVPALTKALDDAEWRVRSSAARELGKFARQASGAVPALEGLLTDTKTGVRVEAALTLWRVTGRPQKSVPVLLAAMKSSDKYDRQRAAWALGAMGPAAERAVSALEEARTDSEGSVRTLAGVALTMVRSAPEEQVRALAEALDHPDSFVTDRVARKLAEMGQAARAAAPALKKALRSEFTDTRNAAADAIKKIKDAQPPSPKSSGAPGEKK